MKGTLIFIGVCIIAFFLGIYNVYVNNKERYGSYSAAVEETFSTSKKIATDEINPIDDFKEANKKYNSEVGDMQETHCNDNKVVSIIVDPLTEDFKAEVAPLGFMEYDRTMTELGRVLSKHSNTKGVDNITKCRMEVSFVFVDSRDFSNYAYRVTIEYDVHNYWETVYPEKTTLTGFNINSIDTF
jgi:hypothetical protein